ncbi:hypothetical protein L3Y34_007237 [Caenorhabditis briggsae]|uniref:Nuclear receptor domain-containing protein n=1 Tax=Caenorhabditis briggsae TaxID=6238 RepID=A0AAE8ZWC4_CAEBR|nr:hypothetical protein L3Y34_007237 [Caenorhabditis briggsae]
MSEIFCQICDLPAHGNHFGAITCRACSAFFRRSLIDRSGENFKCLRGNDSCQLKYSGKFYCKKCRLKKCCEVGMNPKYIQHNRDKIKSSPSPPQSISTLVGRPSYIIHCSPVANASKITIVDVTYLIDKANDCLDYGPALLNKKLKILDKMNIASEFLDSFEASEYSKMDQMTQISVLDKNFFMHFWEVDFLKTAKWLSFLDGFEKIPRAIQIQIIMATWHLRARIDRLSKTAKLRKQMKIGETDFMMSTNACLDLKTCKLDISWCSDYPNEQIQFFLEGSDDWVHNKVVDQMEELKNGIKNYLGRITKMMKINNWIQKVIWEKRWKTELAEKFNIFYFKFSHPEMFYDCC